METKKENFFTLSKDIEKIISQELKERKNHFLGFVVKILAIDCHPWNGVFELCFLVEGDPADKEYIGDWQFFQFTYNDSAGGWPAAQEIRKFIKDEWDLCFSKVENIGLDETNAERAKAKIVSDKIFKACAVALKSENVKLALSDYKTSSDFEFFIGNPDDPEGTNYCDIVSD